MNIEPNAASMTPPTDHAQPEPAPSKWPKVIGVISLIYAIGGLLCGLGQGISIFFMEWLMSLGGMKIQTPALVKYPGVVMSLLMLVLGAIMLSGAIGLLQRKPKGVKLLKLWAVLRIVLILIGIVVTVATAPAQIQFQQSLAEAQADSLRESGHADFIPPEVSDEEMWHRMMLMSAVISVAIAAYPLFLGFYLARRKITNEVELWR